MITAHIDSSIVSQLLLFGILLKVTTASSTFLSKEIKEKNFFFFVITVLTSENVFITKQRMCSVISSLNNEQPLALHAVYFQKEKGFFFMTLINLHIRKSISALLFQEKCVLK